MYFNRTIKAIKMRAMSEDVNPDEIEQLFSPNKNKIKDTLKLLRTDICIPEEYLLNELCEVQIELNDFKEALKKVVPSSKREGFVTVPNVTWDDIGSLKKIREELHMAMLVSILKLLFFYFLAFLSIKNLFNCYRLL